MVRQLYRGVLPVLLLLISFAGQAAPDKKHAAALAATLQGTPQGVAALEDYLASSSGRPEEIANRARNLIKSLAGTEIGADPIALQDAITQISRAARQALFSTPISKVTVLDSFRLTDRSMGFDFGPPDSRVMPQFQHVTAKDKRLSGPKPRAMRRPSGDQLLADGIVNVRKFTADVPNGKWRVVLLTDDVGVGRELSRPLGRSVQVNESTMTIAQNSPDDWLDEAFLSGDTVKVGGATGKKKPPPAQRLGTGTGGMVISEIEISDGKLIVALEPAKAGSTYLTAIIVEPLDEKTNVALKDEAASYYDRESDLRDRTNELIDEEVGVALAEIATAAGPQQIAEALGVEEPTVEPNTLASEN
ncbi:MAG: hypothetical protein QF578_14575 [Alphaproteobacteria bacterium]|jgi:hypothetical protein|nr:hypothetical protein [Alphaproteobacteria bacterium]MDP6566048.1 hypothetical protein [Alphaproteobacteria bacterium]